MALARRTLLALVSHRTAASIRWDFHLLRVRLQSSLRGTRTRILGQIERSDRPLYLNLGSGPRGLDSTHWLNIDAYPDNNVHHLVDFSRGLPLPDGVFNGVFSEHVQEHFDLENGIELLRECHRVLAPGGWLRLIMPDAERIIRTYLNDPQALLTHRPVATNQPMDAVNSYFRQRYEHHCLYDFDLARHAIEDAGFLDVTRVDCGRGSAPPAMMLDDPNYAWESLYIEARKPGVGAAS